MARPRLTVVEAVEQSTPKHWSLTIRDAPPDAPGDLVADVLAHLRRVLPNVGTGRPFDRDAHRQWIVGMEAKYGGFTEELLAWDAWVARRDRKPVTQQPPTPAARRLRGESQC